VSLTTEFPDFCGIAVEFIRSGSNEKLYSRAAGRVGVAVDVVEKAIVALARVLVDSAKAKLDAFSLGLAISALDSVLSEEACRSLTKVMPAPSYAPPCREVLTPLLFCARHCLSSPRSMHARSRAARVPWRWACRSTGTWTGGWTSRWQAAPSTSSASLRSCCD
jgi:hypothetical protein